MFFIVIGIFKMAYNAKGFTQQRNLKTKLPLKKSVLQNKYIQFKSKPQLCKTLLTAANQL